MCVLQGLGPAGEDREPGAWRSNAHHSMRHFMLHFKLPSFASWALLLFGRGKTGALSGPWREEGVDNHMVR